MRTLLAGMIMLAALPAFAASVPLGAGHGARDAERDIDAVALGMRFCEARLLDDMSRVSDHFGPMLTRLLDRIAPEEVPWQSVAMRPHRCEIAVVNGVSDTAGVLLEVNYAADGVTWSDRLGLLRTPSTWLITNVFYEGGGNLRFRLVETR